MVFEVTASMSPIVGENGASNRTSAPTNSTTTANTTGLESWRHRLKLDTSPGTLKGALIPDSSVFMGGAEELGIFSKTGTGSIFKARHMLDASARAKTKSGNKPRLSVSRASILLTGTLSDTAMAAICSPSASRALRNKEPADTDFDDSIIGAEPMGDST